MDLTLFNVEEYTIESIRKSMANHTCRQCAHRKSCKRDHFSDKKNFLYFCDVRDSKRSSTGKLPVRANQPACILFTLKEETK